MAQIGISGSTKKTLTKPPKSGIELLYEYMKKKGATTATWYSKSGTPYKFSTALYERKPPTGAELLEEYKEKKGIPTGGVTGGKGGGVTGGKGGGVTGGEGGGRGYNVNFPTYTLPKIKLNVPTFAWNPTAAEKAGWLSEAEKQAALIVDPQKAAELESLERYKAEVQSQIGEINPRMTQMSIAMANTVQNTIKQEIINELIRRGATTSGEMERQLGAAGRYEVEQRTAIENERNRLLNELAKQQMAREEEYGTRVGELEKIRGLETAVRASELERQAREYEFARKQALFEAELARAQLQNAVAAAKYDAEYKKKLLEADLAQQAWERQYNEQQLALQQQYQNWQMRPAPAATPEYLIPGTTDWLRYNQWQSGYYTDPLTLLNQYLDNLPVVNNVASALAGRVSGGAGGRLY